MSKSYNLSSLRTDAFTSSRLTYRAIDSVPYDRAFLRTIEDDHVAQAMANPSLLLPANTKHVEDLTKWLESCLCAVIVCLKPEEKEKYEKEKGPIEEIDISLGKDGEGEDDNAKKTRAKPRPTPIGFITLGAPRGRGFAIHRSSSIAITLLGPFQGCGYGSEAIRWILDYGFRLAGLHRITIGCLGWNDGARQLYERLGFVPESRLREALWFDGRWWDEFGLAMLDHEWRALKEKESASDS